MDGRWIYFIIGCSSREVSIVKRTILYEISTVLFYREIKFSLKQIYFNHHLAFI